MFDIENLIKYTNKLTLLYVEDNKEARESTLLILDDLFDNIMVAVDGKGGLEKFKNNNIDLIITDINMPNMDGLEMSKLIKKIDNNQSIIILTALTSIEIMKEAIDIDIDSFINKPISDIDLLFHKLEQIAKKIHYDRERKELELIEQEKEKIKLIFEMIKNISHHWKQPLSVITTISSNYSFKIKNNIEITAEDFKGADLITENIARLSDTIVKIEQLNFDTIKIEDINNIIQISNPIYEE